jgi:hypothetical protein
MGARPNWPYRYQMYASLPDEKSVYASAASGPAKTGARPTIHSALCGSAPSLPRTFPGRRANVTAEELETNGLMCGKSLFTPRANKRQAQASDIVRPDDSVAHRAYRASVELCRY